MALSTITLYGEQMCGFDYVVSGDLTDEQILALSQDSNVPQWTKQTEFRVTFTNGLVAGNTDFGAEAPEEWRVYREHLGDETVVYAGSLPGNATEMTDYAIKNGQSYRYHLYPCTSEFVGNPLLSAVATTDWSSWALILVDETDSENEFTLNKLFNFALNREVGTMTNNTAVSKVETFSKYYRIQKSNTNCWSGTLKSLMGTLDEYQMYYDSAAMADAVKELSTDTSHKFLRDIKGHFWKVEITSPISIDINESIPPLALTQSMEWTEIASADGVCIIGGDSA